MRPANTIAQSSGDVLVVDDTLANLRLLINLLSTQGYNVRPAQSGALALAAVKASQPDIILLDINMPGMDGYELCRHLKEDESTRDVPVIFISALNDTESKLKAFTSGGVDYVSKPFQLEEVSARIQTHLTIKQLQDGLEKRNQDLAAFDRSVAHDLRSPLTALIGIAQLMSLGPEYRTDENVAALSESSNRMRCIIDSLLLFAQVGHAEAEIDPIEMRELAEQVKRSLKHEIEAKDAEVSVEGDDWPTALGHEPWVEQVWSNYLSNALKYGGKPPKVVLGWSMGTDGDPEFWVKDNGPGLTEAQCGKVFQEFERLDEAKKEEGHGLGLSIVRRIVDKLGGNVGLESSPGQGSRFYFTLKAASGLRKDERTDVALPG